MKKGICFCLLWLLVLMNSSYAHNLAKGTLEIQGTMDLSFNSIETDTGDSDSEDEDSIAMSVSGFYYVLNNIGVGLSLYFEDYDSTSVDGNYNSKMYILGPALSYNISLDTKLSLKIQGAIGVIKGEGDYDGGDVSTDGKSWQYGGMLSYFVNDNVSINFYLGMISYEMDNTISDLYGYKYTYESDVKGFRSGIGLTTYF